MSTISVRLPDSLHKKAKEIAQMDKISMNQLVATALAEKISAFLTEEYLTERSEKGKGKSLHTILSKVNDTPPLTEDELR